MLEDRPRRRVRRASEGAAECCSPRRRLASHGNSRVVGTELALLPYICTRCLGDRYELQGPELHSPMDESEYLQAPRSWPTAADCASLGRDMPRGRDLR